LFGFLSQSASCKYTGKFFGEVRLAIFYTLFSSVFRFVEKRLNIINIESAFPSGSSIFCLKKFQKVMAGGSWREEKYA
jgi:hypothetical protein